MNSYTKNLVILGVAILLFVLTFIIKSNFYPGAKPGIPVESTASQSQPVSFGFVDLQAKSAFVWDDKTKTVLYAKDENAIRPLASLTKLMTAFAASERLSPTSTITITKEDMSQDGDNGLRTGERWKFRDIVNFTLLTSSNDGAAAIARSAEPFLELMNAKASSLSLSTLHFQNPTGLDIVDTQSGFPIQTGGVGSAKDVTLLTSHILNTAPELLSTTSYRQYHFTSLNGITHYVSNTDKALGSIPGIIGSKTGYTELAGGNLVVIFDEDINHPIIITVLGSTYDGRFDDVIKLASSTRAYLMAKQNYGHN